MTASRSAGIVGGISAIVGFCLLLGFPILGIGC